MDARIAVDGHPPATALHKSAFGEDTAKASDATALSEKDVLEQKDSVERIDGGLRAWLSVVVSFIQFFVVLGKYACNLLYQSRCADVSECDCPASIHLASTVSRSL